MKVEIKSLVGGTLFIKDPDLRIKRTWNKKGAVRTIEKEDLEQMMYNPGVEYMFRQGMLAIVGDNAEQLNIELGLQEEGAEPKILALTDDKIEEIIQMKMPDFRAAVNKLSHEQLQEMVNYCIKNEFTNYDKITLLKDLTQVDILSAIRLNREDKEEVKEA
jgi:DNA polymerase III delta prime subunit